MDKRIGVKNFTLSRADLERYLIKNHGLPEDIVITNIGRPINQEVWCISVQSSSFDKSDDLALFATARNDLFKEGL